MDQASLQQVFSDASSALQSGAGAKAATILQSLDAHSLPQPHASILMFLRAAAAKLQGLNDDAILLFQQSLHYDPDNIQARNSYAILLKSLGKLDEAIEHFSDVTRRKPDYAEAWFNLGLTYQAQDDHQRAIEMFSAANRLQADVPAVLTAWGLSQASLGEYGEAEASYRAALRANPQHPTALYNLASLLRKQFKLKEAEELLTQVIKLVPNVVEPRYLLANIHYEQGDFEKADVGYRTVIGMNPEYIDAHVSLNNLYWEHDKTDLYGKSYGVALQSAPDNATLCEHHIKALEQSGRADEAKQCLHDYLFRHPKHAGLLRLRARSLENAGDYDAAREAYRDALNHAESDTDLRIDAARNAIKLANFKHAQEHLDAALKIAPDNQEVLAYQGLVWRQTDKTRYDWLNDYDQYVKAFILETPDGYNDLGHFLTELADALKTIHTAKRAPIDQTLRGGSQTHGLLLDRQEPAIQALKTALAQKVSDYIDQLPDDPSHPLLRRKSSHFDFSASWSVWLRRDGFHVNHIHSMGWLSSAFYVQVPEMTEVEDTAREGWIKFGESGLHLGDHDSPEKMVKPQAGMLVLFPSYMWHGTIPFSREADRITAPFDVIPRSE